MTKFVSAVLVSAGLLAGCSGSDGEPGVIAVDVVVEGTTGSGWLLSYPDDEPGSDWSLTVVGSEVTTLSVEFRGDLDGVRQLVWRPQWQANGPVSVRTVNGEYSVDDDGSVLSSARFEVESVCSEPGEIRIPVRFSLYTDDVIPLPAAAATVTVSVTVKCDPKDVNG